MHSPTEKLYLKSFQQVYDLFNARFFDGNLPDCIFSLTRNPKVMGYYHSKKFISLENGVQVAEISINSEYYNNSRESQIELCSTIAHEMVHLWQDNFGKPSRKGFHNTEWGKRMLSIGLQPICLDKKNELVEKLCGQKMNERIIIGGLFDRTVKELLENGFIVSHCETDSYIRRNSRPNTIQNQTSEEQVKLDVKQVDLVINGETVNVPTTELIEPEPPIREPKIKKQTRVKYTCSGCKTNIWGKPSLEITCKPCNKDFEANE